MVDYKLKNTWAKMIDEEVNIIECIRLFEEGYDRIYIIDKLTNFFGMVIDKDNLANAWDEDNEVKWITYLTEEDYIYDISNDEVINEKAARLFSENKISSIPIVINNKIEFVINTEKICEINETFLKMILHRDAV
ncbi:hypothetical protein, partial [Anaerocolumna jejuensis]|uniref:hypothetical protein n=1 Tax=Anaerocolumna jejuensis TaxID=259063 RepID=UPI003F7BD419